MSIVSKSCKYKCKVIIDQTNQNHSDTDVLLKLDKRRTKFPKKIKKLIAEECNDMILCFIIPYIQKYVKLYKRAVRQLNEKNAKSEAKKLIQNKLISTLKNLETRSISSKSLSSTKSSISSDKICTSNCHLDDDLTVNSYENMNDSKKTTANYSNSINNDTITKTIIQINNNDGDLGGEDGGEGGVGIDDKKDVLYVDACSLWKFPPWLVDRLDIDQVTKDFSQLSVEKYRSLVMRQIKSTATDLLLYQTVRREFLRTILVIELNNIVKLMDHISKLELDNKLKNEFFHRLKPIVSALDNPEKRFIPEMEEMAYVLDELYVLIAPAHVMKGSYTYHFNIVYSSMLISQYAVSFNENCVGGIVDNNWFSNEAKYSCMVMVTPQVHPRGLIGTTCQIPNNKFRIEAYFDVDRGRYTGFFNDITHNIDPKYILTRSVECVLYSYLTKEAHWVEDKNSFLLNGPDVKGNLNFSNIYYSLIKKASL